MPDDCELHPGECESCGKEFLDLSFFTGWADMNGEGRWVCDECYGILSDEE